MTDRDVSTRFQAADPARGTFGMGKVFGVLAGVVLLGLIVQLPRVADFQKFAFYDEGAWLHLDELVSGGAVPGKDVGYSYGMLPLIVSRAWFAVAGRTPWAFIAFTTLCNIWTAWGVARILVENAKGNMHAARLSLLLAALFLSYGIFPNTYSLMHPLEMALIVSALAQQARGRYGGALAWATLAVFTKPTMGYVLGLLLLLLAAALKKGWKVIVPPVLAGLAAIGAIVLAVGTGPLINTLLPITGGKSYTLMKFGIFRAGMSFWWPQKWDIGSLLNQYLFGPALFWLLATFFLWIAGGMALTRLIARRSPSSDGTSTRDRDALLLTLAVLHAVFVFALYAWAGSWTYYSYLIVLGLIVGIPAINSPRVRRIVMWTFVVVAFLGLSERYGDGFNRWLGMSRPAAAMGLWTYPDSIKEAQTARTMTHEAGRDKSLWMVNGALGQLWPDARVPPSWFLSPGIPTPGELEKLHALISTSDVIVLCKFYDQAQETWNWPEFEEDRAHFETTWEGKEFKVLRRKTGG